MFPSDWMREIVTRNVTGSCVMNGTTRIRHNRRVQSTAVCLALLCAWLAACSGSTGSAGPAGPAGAAGAAGAPGTTTTGSALSVTSATSITGKVLSVAISGPPVVKFQLTDQNGAKVQGLPAADLGVIIAKLVPGLNGAGSQWVSYNYASNAPGACPTGVSGGCATTAQIEAAVESATAGALVDNGDGTYQYTFKKDITKDPKVVYDPTLTHRVGFEIRGLAQANNASYTFQPSTGATTGIFSREIVDTATCDNCHTSLSAHGGARVEAQYCVMCHNPSSIEPSSGNSLDMEVMIHKLHAGINLPSIANYVTGVSDIRPTLNQGYWIVGYGQSLNNFNTVVYPQDTRNCVSCHSQTNPALTQAANFKTVPTIAACGACHDNINFATGAGHSAANIVANDSQCTTCHGATSTIDNGTLEVVAAHTIPVRAFQANLKYNILGATNTGPGQTPTVKFSITNPSNGNKPYALTDAPFPCGTKAIAPTPSNISIAIAWSTTDYTNVGSGVTSEVAQPLTLPLLCTTTTPAPVPLGGGVYSVTTATPIPATVKGSVGLLFQGVAVHNFGQAINGPSDGSGLQEIPVPAAVNYAPVMNAKAVPRREVTPVAKCDVCHYQLNGHGGNRLDSVQSCSFCHNPNATDVVARQGLGITPQALTSPDGLAEQTIDLKVMIHAIHASSMRTSPYVVYHRGAPSNFKAETIFPGPLNNCLSCHDTPAGTPAGAPAGPATYYPPDPNASTVLATTISTYNPSGVSLSTPALGVPTGQTAVTAGTAVCSSCHQGATAAAHMTQNGGSFTAMKDVNSHVAPTETCIVCHGPGANADVAVVHNLAAYQ
jgi:OmcA/MtrC family decaheme c-type cytochrome